MIYFDAENKERLAIAHEPFAHKPISVRKKIKSSLEVAMTGSGQLLQYAITTIEESLPKVKIECQHKKAPGTRLCILK